MQVSYYKDSIKKYMVVPCPEGVVGYQYRMIEMNRIDGILPCEVRYIDGDRFLYYEITGRQSMKSLFEDRRISGAQFRNFLQAIERISDILSEYLLDESQVVLCADQIFLDMNTDQYFFTYYPGEEEASTVFRFIADVIDMSDKAAAACAFRLCALEGDGKAALRQAVHEELNGEPLSFDSLSSRSDREMAQGYSYKKQAYNYSNKNYDYEQAKSDSKSSTCGNPEISDSDAAEEKKKAGKNKNRRRKTKGTKEMRGDGMSTLRKAVRICLIALCILSAAGLIAAQYYLFISEREARLCLVGAALLTAGGILLTADFILRIRRDRAKRKADEQVCEFGNSGEENCDYRPDKLTREELLIHGNNGNNPDTIFLQAEENAGRLYGSGNNRGSRIDLDKLPITIGKASAYADVLLEDGTVSRVHAKIYRTENGDICVKDLGSTNGTWVEGVRINPNENRVIERGQEVRFGRIEYIYR